MYQITKPGQPLIPWHHAMHAEKFGPTLRLNTEDVEALLDAVESGQESFYTVADTLQAVNDTAGNWMDGKPEWERLEEAGYPLVYATVEASQLLSDWVIRNEDNMAYMGGHSSFCGVSIERERFLSTEIRASLR